MEEKNVKMSVKEGKKEKEQKLSYDQLNDVCNQLYQQNQNLARQLQQVNMSNMFKRLDYLFMVLRYESVIKDADFISSCVAEIKDALTISQQEEEEQK